MLYIEKTQGFSQSQELKNELEAKTKNEPSQNQTASLFRYFSLLAFLP